MPGALERPRRVATDVSSTANDQYDQVLPFLAAGAIFNVTVADTSFLPPPTLRQMTRLNPRLGRGELYCTHIGTRTMEANGVFLAILWRRYSPEVLL